MCLSFKTQKDFSFSFEFIVFQKGTLIVEIWETFSVILSQVMLEQMGKDSIILYKKLVVCYFSVILRNGVTKNITSLCLCARPNDVVGQVFVARLAVSLIRLHRGVTFASTY